MRKETPQKAKNLIQELVNVRIKTLQPNMGGFDYYKLFESIMEHNDSQVTQYLSNAVHFYNRYNEAMNKLDGECNEI